VTPCPGCSRLAAHFDGAVPHLKSRDVAFVSISRAPLWKLQACKRRNGWQFPWVSSYGSAYPHDSGWSVFELAGGDVYHTSSRRTRCV
jgi:predicted dithiol-disulfide oxidoreductase (DUF899 family)